MNPVATKAVAYVTGFLMLGGVGLGIGSVIDDQTTRPHASPTQGASPEAGSESTESPPGGESPSAQATGHGASPEASTGHAAFPVTPAPSSQASPTRGEHGSQEESPTPTPPVGGSEPTPGVTVVPTIKPPTPTPTTTKPQTPTPPKPEPPKTVYTWFVPDHTTEENCKGRPSGSIEISIGTKYQSYYDDKDTSKAFNSWGYSKEDTYCP